MADGATPLIGKTVLFMATDRSNGQEYYVPTKIESVEQKDCCLTFRLSPVGGLGTVESGPDRIFLNFADAEENERKVEAKRSRDRDYRHLNGFNLTVRERSWRLIQYIRERVEGGPGNPVLKPMLEDDGINLNGERMPRMNQAQINSYVGVVLKLVHGPDPDEEG